MAAAALVTDGPEVPTNEPTAPFEAQPENSWSGPKRLLIEVAVACLGNPDPVGMKVYAPAGEETFDDIQTTEEAQSGADRREAA